MSITEYSLSVDSFTRYDPHTVSTIKNMVHWYVAFIDSHLIRDSTVASLEGDMVISQI